MSNNCDTIKGLFLAGHAHAAMQGKGDESAYWKHRCKLAEIVIEESPCDPDITSAQIKAHDNYKKFLAGLPIPENSIRDDSAATLILPSIAPAQHAKEFADGDIPHVSIQNDILNISISADELKDIVENNPRFTYVVPEKGKLLTAFAEKVANYQTRNSVEIGLSALQELFETLIEEISTDGEDIIIDNS